MMNEYTSNILATTILDRNTDWDAITNLMCDDVREQTHDEIEIGCSNKIFLKKYIENHYKKYAEIFDIN